MEYSDLGLTSKQFVAPGTSSKNKFSECRCGALSCCADVIAYRCWISPKPWKHPLKVVPKAFESTGNIVASSPM